LPVRRIVFKLEGMPHRVVARASANKPKLFDRVLLLCLKAFFLAGISFAIAW
jgi:hypothetical protein